MNNHLYEQYLAGNITEEEYLFSEELITEGTLNFFKNVADKIKTKYTKLTKWVSKNPGKYTALISLIIATTLGVYYINNMDKLKPEAKKSIQNAQDSMIKDFRANFIKNTIKKEPTSTLTALSNTFAVDNKHDIIKSLDAFEIPNEQEEDTYKFITQVRGAVGKELERRYGLK